MILTFGENSPETERRGLESQLFCLIVVLSSASDSTSGRLSFTLSKVALKQYLSFRTVVTVTSKSLVHSKSSRKRSDWILEMQAPITALKVLTKEAQISLHVILDVGTQ